MEPNCKFLWVLCRWRNLKLTRSASSCGVGTLSLMTRGWNFYGVDNRIFRVFDFEVQGCLVKVMVMILNQLGSGGITELTCSRPYIPLLSCSSLVASCCRQPSHVFGHTITHSQILRGRFLVFSQLHQPLKPTK